MNRAEDEAGATMAEPYLTDVGWSGSALRVAGAIRRDGEPPAVPEMELVLRERDGGGLLRLPASATAENGLITFEALVDVASVERGEPLPGGLWDVDLAIGAPPEGRVFELGPERAPGLDTSPQRRFLPGAVTVAAYFGGRGTLSIDVGGRSHVAGTTAADGVAWDERRGEVVITGHIDRRWISMPVSGTLILTERRTRDTFEVIAALEESDDRLGYRAALPVTRAFVDDPLPRGSWDVALCIGFSGMHRELGVLAPGDPVDVQVWRRFRHVRVASSAAPDPLTITVGRA
ncbi:hypothetical protein [Actinomadura verrucosospora]|uniref:CDP-glycerol:poly(Glycerophosphate) glycerophosphotransferase n=1 Tax=Actinomadura verrucosospora TaxID=46165 RepID=A0A7D3VS41_ACTVE|nr:hypothetical protein [Actinomadura verrucosospora]QKG21059.1 CDP-glycerol:poly(glycerophosphate) glycerophosphotransferase [Actinomadura verrucosospora]